MKIEETYHFSFPFEYIEVNHGNDEYDIGIAYMECDVRWDEANEGYTCNYYCNEESNIDPDQGNGTIDDFFEDQIKYPLQDAMEEEGIGIDSLCLDML